ncbi:ATPase [Streptomyces sp. NPDC087903]
MDRLTSNGAIIQTGTESHRLAHTKAHAQRAEAS